MFAIHVTGILNHVPAAAAWVVQEGGGAMATDASVMVGSGSRGSSAPRLVVAAPSVPCSM